MPASLPICPIFAEIGKKLSFIRTTDRLCSVEADSASFFRYGLGAVDVFVDRRFPVFRPHNDLIHFLIDIALKAVAELRGSSHVADGALIEIAGTDEQKNQDACNK